MFWALAQRQKDIDKARGQGREEGREEVIRKMADLGVELPEEILKELKDKC